MRYSFRIVAPISFLFCIALFLPSQVRAQHGGHGGGHGGHGGGVVSGHGGGRGAHGGGLVGGHGGRHGSASGRGLTGHGRLGTTARGHLVPRGGGLHGFENGHGRIYRDRIHDGLGHPGGGTPHDHHGFGFQHDAFGLHHGLGVGITLGFLPFFGPWNGYAYPYYYRDPYVRDSLLNQVDPLPQADTLEAADTLPPFDGRVAVPGPTGADSLVVEEVTLGERAPPILRVTWQDMGRQAEEVALFLTDTTRSILAVQTLRTPPFTALFEPPAGTAFAGMTVVWPSGSKSTRLVALGALSR